MFEFDPVKSAANLAKHGIDFEQAQALWDDPQAIETETAFLPEDRQLIIAALHGKVWTAVFTMRGANRRIISVRRARVKEELAYGTQEDQC